MKFLVSLSLTSIAIIYITTNTIPVIAVTLQMFSSNDGGLLVIRGLGSKGA